MFIFITTSNIFTSFFNIIGIGLNRRNILIYLVLSGIIIPLSGIFNHNLLDFLEFLMDFTLQIYFITNKNANLKSIMSRILKYSLLTLSFLLYLETFIFLSKLNNIELNFTFLILFFFSMVFNRSLKLIIIKQNKSLKLYYFILVSKFRELKQKFSLFIKVSLVFFNNYPLVVLGLLHILSYFTHSYLLLFFYSVRLFFVSLCNLDYFKDLKVIRQNDIKSFNYHWSVDSDLKILDKVILYSKILGVLIFLFSYYFNINNLGALGNQYQLFSFSYCNFFRTIHREGDCAPFTFLLIYSFF